MEMADVAVAMGNAVDGVKAVADLVTSCISENGVYEACVQLGLFKD
jgi:hydroxymethylpyrimidine pyrophosphatase-like HAD family hydrolase